MNTQKFTQLIRALTGRNFDIAERPNFRNTFARAYLARIVLLTIICLPFVAFAIAGALLANF